MYQCFEDIVAANEVLTTFGDSGLERVAQHVERRRWAGFRGGGKLRQPPRWATLESASWKRHSMHPLCGLLLPYSHGKGAPGRRPGPRGIS